MISDFITAPKLSRKGKEPLLAVSCSPVGSYTRRKRLVNKKSKNDQRSLHTFIIKASIDSCIIIIVNDDSK